jgi:hypothetical protein
MSSRRKRGWAHHQPEAVVLDLVNPEISAAFLFSALRFLVAVSSLQRLQLRVEGAFQQNLETALILAFANPSYLFHRPTPLSRAYCATRFVTIIRVGRKDRTAPLGLAKNGAVRVIAQRTGCRIGA